MHYANQTNGYKIQTFYEFIPLLAFGRINKIHGIYNKYNELAPLNQTTSNIPERRWRLLCLLLEKIIEVRCLLKTKTISNLGYIPVGMPEERFGFAE